MKTQHLTATIEWKQLEGLKEQTFEQSVADLKWPPPPFLFFLRKPTKGTSSIQQTWRRLEATSNNRQNSLFYSICKAKKIRSWHTRTFQGQRIGVVVESKYMILKGNESPSWVLLVWPHSLFSVCAKSGSHRFNRRLLILGGWWMDQMPLSLSFCVLSPTLCSSFLLFQSNNLLP